jgi:hypothetical protein
LRVPSHNFSDGEAVRVRAIGQLQTGLSENTTYYVKRHSSQPAHWIQLFNNQALTNLVTFTSTNKFGIYTIYTEAHPAPLAADNWSIHRGNRDPVHQQTISDVGWRMNRNVFGDRRGLAAGTIAQVTLGGLCDIPYWITGSLAAGFNSSAEADFSYSLGKDLRNVTPESVEIGVDDSFKLRVTPNKASLITSGVESQLITSLPTGKTIYVDAATGTDTRTGLSKYDQFKPYATLSAAETASLSGDLVYVRAGSYAIDSQINLNDEGHLYFEPGATVNVATGVTAFSFNQATNAFPTANSIRIQGHADFVLSGSAGILTIPTSNNTSSPPIVAFECNSITGPDAANGTLFNIVNGVLSVDAKTIAMTTTFTASNATVFNIASTGDVTARIPFVYCGRFVNGSGSPGAVARAQINADIWTLATYNATAGMDLRLITTNFRIVNYNHVGVGAALSWTENTTTEAHGFQGITWSSLIGQPHITFASTAASTTNKIIRLGQTNIMRAATTNSLSSNVPINVGTYGTFASVPATSNVTFKIGSFTVDADVNTY